MLSFLQHYVHEVTSYSSVFLSALQVLQSETKSAIIRQHRFNDDN